MNRGLFVFVFAAVVAFVAVALGVPFDPGFPD